MLYSPQLIAALALIGSPCLVVFSAMQLRSNHGDDLRIVWYFFSLSLVVTSGLTYWAVSHDALDLNGDFHGAAGSFLRELLKTMIDIDASAKIVLAIVGLIVVPQLLSYFLSGLFGVAGIPVLIRGSVLFVVWSLVKSFTVLAGILWPLSLFIILGTRDWQEGLRAQFLPSTSIALAFALLLAYREGETFLARLERYWPALHRICATFHKWCTRANPKSSSRHNVTDP